MAERNVGLHTFSHRLNISLFIVRGGDIEKYFYILLYKEELSIEKYFYKYRNLINIEKYLIIIFKRRNLINIEKYLIIIFKCRNLINIEKYLIIIFKYRNLVNIEKYFSIQFYIYCIRFYIQPMYDYILYTILYTIYMRFYMQSIYNSVSYFSQRGRMFVVVRLPIFMHL